MKGKERWMGGAVFESANPIYVKDGEDLIARWARTKTPEQFRAAMLFNIEKYSSRYGLKDSEHKEASKIADYSARLAQYELELSNNKGVDK